MTFLVLAQMPLRGMRMMFIIYHFHYPATFLLVRAFRDKLFEKPIFRKIQDPGG